MKDKSSYIFSADIIRVIAIFAVVVIHTTNAIYTRLDFFGGVMWWVSLFLDSLSRISIPLFIMLSGYLMLGKNESINKTLKRILFRILIPLVFAVIFYSWYAYGKPSLNHIHLNTIFERLFKADVYNFYFLVIIAGLYFFTPLISSYLRSASTVSQKILMWFLITIGVVEVFSQFLFRTCNSDNFFTFWIPYTGLFVAGYVLGKNSGNINKKKLAVIYFLSLATTFAMNYLFYFLLLHKFTLLSPKGCLSHYFDHYLSINVVAMSMSAFLLLLNFKYIRIKKNSIGVSLINSIARTSLGIYILHLFVSRFLEVQFLLHIDFTKLPISIFLFTKLFLVFILSYLLTLLVSKIPILRKLLGFS